MTVVSDNHADRASQLTRELIGHAIKVRSENPEYAQTPEQNAMVLSMEPGRLAMQLSKAEQQQMVEGLKKGLNSLKLDDTERQAVLNQVAPKIHPGFSEHE